MLKIRGQLYRASKYFHDNSLHFIISTLVPQPPLSIVEWPTTDNFPSLSNTHYCQHQDCYRGKANKTDRMIKDNNFPKASAQSSYNTHSRILDKPCCVYRVQSPGSRWVCHKASHEKTWFMYQANQLLCTCTSFTCSIYYTDITALNSQHWWQPQLCYGQWPKSYWVSLTSHTVIDTNMSAPLTVVPCLLIHVKGVSLFFSGSFTVQGKGMTWIRLVTSSIRISAVCNLSFYHSLICTVDFAL